MRVDVSKFRENKCNKCKDFAGDKLTFGKCMACFSHIYRCAKSSIFNLDNTKELEISKEAAKIYQEYDESIESSIEIARNILR